MGKLSNRSQSVRRATKRQWCIRPYRRDQGTSRVDRRCGKVHQQSPTDGAPPADVLTAQCTHSCRQRQRNCSTWGRSSASGR